MSFLFLYGKRLEWDLICLRIMQCQEKQIISLDVITYWHLKELPWKVIMEWFQSRSGQADSCLVICVVCASFYCSKLLLVCFISDDFQLRQMIGRDRNFPYATQVSGNLQQQHCCNPSAPPVFAYVSVDWLIALNFPWLPGKHGESDISAMRYEYNCDPPKPVWTGPWNSMMQAKLWKRQKNKVQTKAVEKKDDRVRSQLFFLVKETWIIFKWWFHYIWSHKMAK